MRAQAIEHAIGLLARTEPQAEPSGRAGDDLIRRSLDRMAVDPDHGDARPQPQAFVQRDVRVADELNAGAHAERAGEALRRVVEAGDRGALLRRGFGKTVERAVEREVAMLVDE